MSQVSSRLIERGGLESRCEGRSSCLLWAKSGHAHNVCSRPVNGSLENTVALIGTRLADRSSATLGKLPPHLFDSFVLYRIKQQHQAIGDRQSPRD